MLLLEVRLLTLEKHVLFLLEKKRQMSGKELIAILEEMKFTAPSIRNALAKLKKTNLIVSAERGSYNLTKKGLFTHANYLPQKNYYKQEWSRQWLIVLVGIPEAERKKRDRLRFILLQMGFGLLYKGVYIYPWDVSDKLLTIIDELEIEDFVTITLSPEFLLNNIRADSFTGPNTAKKIWKLTDLQSHYENQLPFLNESRQLLDHLSKDIGKTNLFILAQYLTIYALKEELLNRDPMLPPEFLPSNWQGIYVLKEMDDLLQQFALFLRGTPYEVFI